MILSAFFSGMEIAFVSSNRMLAEMDKEKNQLSQRLVFFFYHHANGFVSTMLVGNNVVLVVYGILFARIFDNTVFTGFDARVRLTLDTLLSTLVMLFTGEFLPKTFFKSSPNKLLSFFAPIGCHLLCVIMAGQQTLNILVPYAVENSRHSYRSGEIGRELYES